MPREFAITFDYLCPFARNANEHVVTALRGGADWDVPFVPFSLAQVHVEEGGTDVWDREDWRSSSGVLALSAGLAVRERWPERFLDAHVALFAARHDEGGDIRDPDVVRRALSSAGLDADEVFDEITGGAPLEALRKEHTAAADDHDVFGVPTFVADGDAVFVRLMHRPEGDADRARTTIERVLDLLTGWPELNEFKRTRIPR